MNILSSLSPPQRLASQEETSNASSIYQTGLIALGAITAYLVYRPYINRMASACYQSIARRILSLFIKNTLPLWEGSLSKFKKSRLQQKEATALDTACDYAAIRQESKIVEPAAALLIKELFAKYIPQGPILELGSNLLDENGNSYLARLLPQEYLSRLTYSDCSEDVVASQKLKTNRKYLALDAAQLNLASKTNIAAINVFDILQRNQFAQAAAGIYQGLGKNGRIAILSDMPFDQFASFNKHSTRDNFLFPTISGNDLAIKIVRKDVLINRSRPFGPEFTNFVQSVMELPQDQRTLFLCGLFFYDQSLSEILESICSKSDLQTIDHKNSYLADLKEAFEAHGGFEIVVNDFIEKEALIPRTSGTKNTFSSDLRDGGLLSEGFNPKLKQNIMAVRTVFHVMIAKKRLDYPW